ncbi:MAG: helix-turn-helix domain-containing protein [Phycisphaerae bacterium]|nr:helix-turn-helix domain-containing protein [Phycisphaerae bacterium]
MDSLESTTWGKMLNNYRHNAGLTKSALARAVGVTVGYISKLESGKTPPPENQRMALCNALELTSDQARNFHIKAELERADPIAVKYITQLTQIKYKSPKRSYSASAKSLDSFLPPGAKNLSLIPIINKAATGYPQDFTDLDYPINAADDYIAVPDISDPKAFGFYVSGDSMEPEFPGGTLLITSPNIPAFEADPCFIRFSPACRERGCSFKKVYFMPNNQVRLVPLNRRYAEQIFKRDDLTSIWPVVRVYGKVNRNVEKPATRKSQSHGRTFEESSDRRSSAAG